MAKKKNTGGSQQSNVEKFGMGLPRKPQNNNSNSGNSGNSSGNSSSSTSGKKK